MDGDEKLDTLTPLPSPDCSNVSFSRNSRFTQVPVLDEKAYLRRVSFDNVSGLSSSLNTYTLRTASQGYQSTHTSRTFMVPTAFDNMSDLLEYTFRHLVDDGDEVIFVSTDTSPHESLKEKAAQMMTNITSSYHGQKQIRITVEVVLDRPERSLQAMIMLYQPTLLIIGTCHKRLFSARSSIVRYSLKESPVPIITINHMASKSSEQHEWWPHTSVRRLLRPFMSVPHLTSPPSRCQSPTSSLPKQSPIHWSKRLRLLTCHW